MIIKTQLFAGDVSLADSKKLTFGASDDLKIYHDPSIGSVIEESGAGDLFIDTNQAIRFRKAGSSELMALMTPDDSVDLYYDNSKKFETTSQGISVMNTGANAFIKINREDATTSGALFLQSSNGTNGINSNGVKDLKISTNNTERMRIDSAGNVGIGTSSPSRLLDVDGIQGWSHSDVEVAYLNPTSTGVDFALKNSSGTSVIRLNGTPNNDSFINTGGNVGIGTTAPTAKIQIESTSAGAASVAAFLVNSSTTLNTETRLAFAANTNSDIATGRYSYISTVNTSSSNGQAMTFATNATGASAVERMRITSAGNVGIGNTSPNDLLQVGGTGGGNASISIASGGGSDSTLYFRRSTTYDAYIKVDSNEDLLIGYNSANLGDNLKIISNTGEVMRIDSTGNVGIGVTPNASHSKLQVKSPASSYGFDLIGRDDGANSESQITFWNSAQTSTLAAIFNIADEMAFATGTTERMRINSSGDILFGTTAEPNGTSAYGSAFTVESNNRKALLQASSTTSSTTLQAYFNPNGVVGSISTSGSATAYNTSSDYRLKENVVEMTGALDRVAQLKPSRFNFKTDSDTTVDGFLAHEVQEVVPEAITGTKDAMKDEEYEVTPAVYDGDELVTEAVMGTRSVEDYQGIDQSKLVPLLVGAIQELQARIKVLESK